MGLFQKSIKASELTSFSREQLKTVIDVRSNAEFKQGNVKGTVNVPAEKLTANPSRYLQTDKEYYVICQSGMRSRGVVSNLKRQGYTNITNVKGGFLAYARIQNN